MHLHNIFETLYVYRDQLSQTELWELIDSISDRDSLEISEWLYKNNTGLPGKVVDQIQGIHQWYRENGRFMTDNQRRWLLINTLDHWDKLTFRGRQRIS
jgi:hypothetical protein